MVACGNIRDKYLQLICISLNVPVRRNDQERVSLAMDPSEHCKDFTERRGDPSWTRPALRHVKGRDFWKTNVSPRFNASRRLYFFRAFFFFPSILSLHSANLPSPDWSNWQTTGRAHEREGIVSFISRFKFPFPSPFVLLALWTNGLGLACGPNFQVESLPSPILH